MVNQYIRTEWKTTELSMLENSLYNGMLLEDLEVLLPWRSPKAILKKSLGFEFSSKTVDGVIVMKSGVNRLVINEQNEAVDINTIVGEPTVSDTTEGPVILVQRALQQLANDILARESEKEGINAYIEASDILKANNLPAEHTTVCMLSTLILEVAQKDL